MKRRFATKKSVHTVITVAAGALLLVLSVGLPILLMPKENIQFQTVWLFPIAMVLFMLFILLGSAMQLLASFIVDGDALLLLIPPFHRRKIEGRSIRAVRVIDMEETRAIFESAVRERYDIAEGAELGRYIRLLRSMTPEFRYLSITPVTAAAETGARRHFAAQKVWMKERMVLLTLDDDTRCYLSPGDVDGFVRAVGEIIPSVPEPRVIPAPSSSPAQSVGRIV